LQGGLKAAKRLQKQQQRQHWQQRRLQRQQWQQQQ
jgi:hypothetical protein